MKPVKRKGDTVKFGDDEDFVGSNVSSINRGKFVKKPTDSERAALYNLLAALLEGGLDFETAVSYLAKEANAERLPISLAISDYFGSLKEMNATDLLKRGPLIDQKIENCFGKGVVFGEELLALHAMVIVPNPVALLKVASGFAEAASKREQTKPQIERRAEA
jgi:hypothetical protein